MGVVFLFDSAHPQQFKVEWMDTPMPGGVAGGDGGSGSGSGGVPASPRQYALNYMSVIMRALHFDFEEVGWDDLSIDEKFRIFEDLTYQALGKHYDANAFADSLDSSKPMAEHWKSGIVRKADGSLDTSAWRLLAGNPCAPTPTATTPVPTAAAVSTCASRAWRPGGGRVKSQLLFLAA